MLSPQALPIKSTPRFQRHTSPLYIPASPYKLASCISSTPWRRSFCQGLLWCQTKHRQGASAHGASIRCLLQTVSRSSSFFKMRCAVIEPDVDYRVNQLSEVFIERKSVYNHVAIYSLSTIRKARHYRRLNALILVGYRPS